MTIQKFNNIHPLRFGDLSIWPPFAAAPMAGYTDAVFRDIQREFGCPLCFTEMVSAKGIIQHNHNTLSLLRHSETDKPLAVQVFGEDPEDMFQAVQIIGNLEFSFEAIDINMGCPARKVTCQGAGGALLKDVSRAVEIVEAVKDAASVPVSVKMRTGWDSHKRACDIANRLAEAGADMLTVHGRTVSQGFSGTSDWSVISNIASSVDIPVVGNGDVKLPEQGLLHLEKGSCSGIMVGRGILGNPFFWRHLNQVLQGAIVNLPDNRERLEAARNHLGRGVEFYGPDKGLVCMKKHLGFYVKGMKGASKIREIIHRASSVDDLMMALEEFGVLQ
ncbi:MAG: tRNA dihydrouridine synthase DusB [Bacillota bacterium]